MQVKIIGAGSIGNHLAQASRRMGWEVVVVDTDPKSLVRMREEIYPKRYGAWDDEIKLFLSGEEPKGGFDIIMVGTPPDVRMKVATEVLKEKPRLLHLEKPMCTPMFFGLEAFEALRKNYSTLITVGYNHTISSAVKKMQQLLMDGMVGEVLTIDVEFREHWQGIFDAHPWLSSDPSQSYLGSWRNGGGAGGEHSHALHLWICLAQWAGWGDPMCGIAMFDMLGEQRFNKEYDRLASFTLKAEDGKVGRVIQDVITNPPRKWARVQGAQGWIEWQYKGIPEGDLLRFELEKSSMVQEIFPHTRPDDFYYELVHYQKMLLGTVNYHLSPLSFEKGKKVMEILHDFYWGASYCAHNL